MISLPPWNRCLMSTNVRMIPNTPLSAWTKRPGSLSKKHARPSLPQPGRLERHDYEYERCGVFTVFMANEPLAGKRMTKVSERKTKSDWAAFIRQLEEQYPHAEKITLVMDNLSTHKPGSLYEAFPPEEAKRIRDRFEFVYTPKHGSWLNMAEIELNVLIGQCLNRRMGSLARSKQPCLGLADPSRQPQCEGKLALHDTRCSGKVTPSLSDVRNVVNGTLEEKGAQIRHEAETLSFLPNSLPCLLPIPFVTTDYRGKDEISIRPERLLQDGLLVAWIAIFVDEDLHLPSVARSSSPLLRRCSWQVLLRLDVPAGSGHRPRHSNG